MLTQPTEGRETIIRKNKHQTYRLTFLLMSPEGRLLQSIPWTKRDCGSVATQKQGKDSVRSDLGNKLFLEDIFREKVIAKYDSYKNSQQTKIWMISLLGFLKDFEHKTLCLWQLQITRKIFLLVPPDFISEGCQHRPEAKEETASAAENQRWALEGRWMIQPRGWVQKDPLEGEAREWGQAWKCGSPWGRPHHSQHISPALANILL